MRRELGCVFLCVAGTVVGGECVWNWCCLSWGGRRSVGGDDARLVSVVLGCLVACVRGNAVRFNDCPALGVGAGISSVDDLSDYFCGVRMRWYLARERRGKVGVLCSASPALCRKANLLSLISDKYLATHLHRLKTESWTLALSFFARDGLLHTPTHQPS